MKQRNPNVDAKSVSKRENCIIATGLS